LLLVLKLGVAAALLVWLITSGKLEPQRLADAVRRSPLWLALALLAFNACVVITALRWRTLLLAHGIGASRWACVKMTYVGCFFSNFLPGGTGGDLVKAYYVARDAPKRAEAATTVFLDRVLALYCLVGLAAVAVLARVTHLWSDTSPAGSSSLLMGLSPTQWLVVAVLGGFAAATAGLVLFLSSHCRRLVHWLTGRLPHRVGGTLSRVYEAVYHYRGHKAVLLRFALYSVAAHVLAVASLWLVGVSLREPVACGGTRAFSYLFLIPLGTVFAGLPLAPAGVGVYEWALGFLFATVVAAGEPNLGASVAALGHVVIILTNLVGLVFYLQHKRHTASPVLSGGGT